MLQDGAGSTRQLVDEEGAVNLSVSYTPWGDTMEIYGSGNLDLGYLGGVYDAGTGLIYMGNGQYYDPYTRRFLNRGGENQSDPYAPWSNNIASMLISPLTLLAMVYGRKKKRTKFDNVIIVFVLVLTLSTSMFVVSESFIPSVSADVDRPPIGWPPNPEEVDTYITLPADIQVSAYAPVLKIMLNYCNMPKPDIENYDPTVEPKEFISWGPSVYLDSDLFQFNGSQEAIDVNMDSQFTAYDELNSGYWGPNLCGQASLSIVIQSTLGEVFPLTEIVNAVDEHLGTGGKQHNQTALVADYLGKALSIARKKNNYQIGFKIVSNQNIYTYTGFGPYDHKLLGSRSSDTYSEYEPVPLEYVNFMKSQLAQNHYHIALVTIDCTNEGILTDYISNSSYPIVNHWVVVSGFSEQWNTGPDFQWVRIYNPYYDRTEYYPASVFLNSVHPQWSLELWQMGASPYIEGESDMYY